MSFAGFLQSNGVLADEIRFALRSLGFFGVCADRRTSIQKLTTYVSTNAWSLIKLVTQLNDPHCELKRSFSDVFHRILCPPFFLFPFSFFLRRGAPAHRPSRLPTNAYKECAPYENAGVGKRNIRVGRASFRSPIPRSFPPESSCSEYVRATRAELLLLMRPNVRQRDRVDRDST